MYKCTKYLSQAATNQTEKFTKAAGTAAVAARHVHGAKPLQNVA